NGRSAGRTATTPVLLDAAAGDSLTFLAILGDKRVGAFLHQLRDERKDAENAEKRGDERRPIFFLLGVLAPWRSLDAAPQRTAPSPQRTAHPPQRTAHPPLHDCSMVSNLRQDDRVRGGRLHPVQGHAVHFAEQ